MKMSPLGWVAFVLTVIGGLNWGLVGALNFNLVTTVLDTVPYAVQIVYVLVGLSALYLVVEVAMKASKGHSAPQM